MTNVSHKRLGMLFILIGPTGAGKNTIMNRVLQSLPDLKQLPTATTRPIRDNEREGREHLFVSYDEFQRMIRDGELIEWQEVYQDLLYGVPRSTVEAAILSESDRVADVDVLGAMRVRAAYPDNVVLIFVQPGETDDVSGIIRNRLEKRGETQEDINTRLKRVEMEMRYAPLCDYLIINDQVDTAARTLEGIIASERSRRSMINLRVARGEPRHRLIYTASALVSVGERVLVSSDGTLPGDRLRPGELPAEALERVLPASVAALDAAAPPDTISYVQMAHHEQLTFWYIYTTPQVPVDGWTWQTLDQIDMPDSVRNVVQSLPYKSPEKT